MNLEYISLFVSIKRFCLSVSKSTILQRNYTKFIRASYDLSSFLTSYYRRIALTKCFSVPCDYSQGIRCRLESVSRKVK